MIRKYSAKCNILCLADSRCVENKDNLVLPSRIVMNYPTVKYTKFCNPNIYKTLRKLVYTLSLSLLSNSFSIETNFLLFYSNYSLNEAVLLTYLFLSVSFYNLYSYVSSVSNTFGISNYHPHKFHRHRTVLPHKSTTPVRNLGTLNIPKITLLKSEIKQH